MFHKLKRLWKRIRHPEAPALEYASTDELIAELRSRFRSYIITGVGEPKGTFRLHYGGNTMEMLGLTHNARNQLRDDIRRNTYSPKPEDQ